MSVRFLSLSVIFPLWRCSLTALKLLSLSAEQSFSAFLSSGGRAAAAPGGEGDHAEQEDKADPGDGRGEGHPGRGDPRPQGHAGGEGAQGERSPEEGECAELWDKHLWCIISVSRAVQSLNCNVHLHSGEECSSPLMEWGYGEG